MTPGEGDVRRKWGASVQLSINHCTSVFARRFMGVTVFLALIFLIHIYQGKHNARTCPRTPGHSARPTGCGMVCFSPTSSAVQANKRPFGAAANSSLTQTATEGLEGCWVLRESSRHSEHCLSHVRVYLHPVPRFHDPRTTRASWQKRKKGSPKCSTVIHPLVPGHPQFHNPFT